MYKTMTGFVFGVISYAAFLTSFLYSIGFVGNLVVPKSIDSGQPAPFNQAVLINGVLLALFAIQHSVMARPAFKRWWTRIVPTSLERSVYVLLSSMALILLFWQWQAIPNAVWDVENPLGRHAIDGLFWVGWLVVVWSTFLVSHFDLFGLRQVYLRIRGIEYTPLRFRAGALYKYVRHPMMLGFLIAFWASPHMTVGHLFFSIVMTGYIVVGIFLEERDHAAIHGDVFERYRDDVPMIVPMPSGWSE